MSREPGTAAGRRVQRELEYLSLEPVESIRAKVLAIEDEARQQGRDREALRQHEPIVFAPATDDITIRCRCGQPPEGMREGEFMAHVLRALASADGPPEPGIDVERLARAIRESPTARAVLGRLGRFNDVWWERFAGEVLARLSADGDGPGGAE